MPLPPTAKKLRTLAQIAAKLQEGEHFPITRLTTLKGFCEDPEAAAKFALYLAKLTQAKAKPTKPEYERLIADGVRAMTRHLRKPTEQSKSRLEELLAQAKQAQNKFEHQQWADVRIVECWDLLIVETAMECILQPWYSSVHRLPTGEEVRRKVRFTLRVGPESEVHPDDGGDRGVLGAALLRAGMEEGGGGVTGESPDTPAFLVPESSDSNRGRHKLITSATLLCGFCPRLLAGSFGRVQFRDLAPDQC